MASPEDSALIYTRQSKAPKWGGSQTSSADQEAEARRIATRHGLDVVHVYREALGTSASRYGTKARPQWEAALSALRDGTQARTLIVWELSRSDRTGAAGVAGLLDEFEGSRRIITADGTDTADPKQRISIVLKAEIDRDEVERTRVRINRTIAARREAGLWHANRPPFGLRVNADQRLEPDPVTFPTARRIADGLLSGQSAREVAARLNADGIPSPGGSTWSGLSIGTMVRSPGWAGLQAARKRTKSPTTGRLTYAAVADVYVGANGQPVSVGEGVITSDERTVILSLLASRRLGAPGGGKRPRALLADVLVCGVCGARCIVAGGGSTRSYRCRVAAKNGQCPGASAVVGPVEDHVVIRARTRLGALDPTDSDDYATLERVAATWDRAEASRRAEVIAARATLADAEEREARVVPLALAGVLSPEEAAAARQEAREAVQVARAALSAAERPSGDVVSVLLDSANTPGLWDDDGQARRMLAAMLREVRLAPAGGRRGRFDAEARLTFDWR